MLTTCSQTLLVAPNTTLYSDLVHLPPSRMRARPSSSKSRLADPSSTTSRPSFKVQLAWGRVAVRKLILDLMRTVSLEMCLKKCEFCRSSLMPDVVDVDINQVGTRGCPCKTLVVLAWRWSRGYYRVHCRKCPWGSRRRCV